MVTIRITVSPDLAKKIDLLVKYRGFASRSDLVKEALRRFVVEEYDRYREQQLREQLLKKLRRKLDAKS